MPTFDFEENNILLKEKTYFCHYFDVKQIQISKSLVFTYKVSKSVVQLSDSMHNLYSQTYPNCAT